VLGKKNDVLPIDSTSAIKCVVTTSKFEGEKFELLPILGNFEKSFFNEKYIHITWKPF
jgi:hypothetical protein